MPYKVAKIAVSGATYWIDRPYDYFIPEELSHMVCEGMRVFVPFSRSNRRCEGIVLSIIEKENVDDLKSIISVLDTEPVLSKMQINLALFMRERFFCTVYEAVRCMLPTGLWFDIDGSRKVKDKTDTIICLGVSSQEAKELMAEKQRKAPKQAALLKELIDFGEFSEKELLRFTSSGKTSVKALVDEGICYSYQKEVFRRPEVYCSDVLPLPTLNEEQNLIFEDLIKKINEENLSVSLLQGVTGSGKTSVYIKLIADVLEKGKSAIMLVPEIALTPQMIQTFSSYFGNTVAVLHSSLTMCERYDEWKRIKSSRARLVIGTRSAIFAPCDNLGLIVIDEQQEDTYKSENNPRYDAQTIANYIAYKNNCALILGSATPDVCTRYKAETGIYNYYRLNKRYNQKPLPKVAIVDLKKELQNGNDGQISSFLKNEIQKNIDAGEQTILFLNRRGTHKLVTCGVCGYIYKCPNCSVSLTYHTNGNKLMCHYCGFSKKLDKNCPDCGGELKYLGAGTQLVENELHLLFPNVETIRIDADVLNSKVSHEDIFRKFTDEKIPIMIGTQMVTKGLNFDNVTLVGVLSADQSLYTGDYRAGERTFSQITQVIGRSGRGEKPGRAVIQTFTPDNETIQQSASQNYDDFYSTEILLRQINITPPFCDYLCITVYGKNEAEVVKAARYAKRLAEVSTSNINKIEILGPAPMSVVKVNNIYRYRVNIKCVADNTLRRRISDVVIACNTNKEFKGISFYVDNDPND